MPELPEELVEKAAEVAEDRILPFDAWNKLEPADLAKEMLDAIALSSILERLERALAVAEKFEKEAWEWKAKATSNLRERDDWKATALDPSTGHSWKEQAQHLQARLSGGPVAATPPTEDAAPNETMEGSN